MTLNFLLEIQVLSFLPDRMTVKVIPMKLDLIQNLQNNYVVSP